MKALAIGARIWFKTIVLNALLFGIGGLWMEGWVTFGLAFFVFIAALILTLPLLLIIVPLVQLSARIPYNTKARIAWLTFYLLLLIIAIYIAFGELFNGLNDPLFPTLTGTTIAGLLIAVYTTRTSLLEWYHQHDEAAQLHNVLKIINT
jgi:hypothetical protein